MTDVKAAAGKHIDKTHSPVEAAHLCAGAYPEACLVFEIPYLLLDRSLFPG